MVTEPANLLGVWQVPTMHVTCNAVTPSMLCQQVSSKGEEIAGQQTAVCLSVVVTHSSWRGSQLFSARDAHQGRLKLHATWAVLGRP